MREWSQSPIFHETSHPNNLHNLLSKSSQSNLNGPNNHGLDGELIALDTNLDEMEGIIDRDHVMFQLRRNSSMSAGTTNNMSIPPRDALSGFNNTSSPPHPHPHQLHDSATSGNTLCADPFNPGRTLGLASTANGPTHHHPCNGTFKSDRQVVDSVKHLTQDPSHQSPHLQ
ncbi:hypothetical protein DFH28DRAFT_1143801 [Melampsora americana]|nr:hypothetical protein DFH28DRAFT_1143801 [Melampsora americana]